jgi:hypothetical protein
MAVPHDRICITASSQTCIWHDGTMTGPHGRQHRVGKSFNVAATAQLVLTQQLLLVPSLLLLPPLLLLLLPFCGTPACAATSAPPGRPCCSTYGVTRTALVDQYKSPSESALGKEQKAVVHLLSCAAMT